jgi:uncharacterized protein YbjT (DUF2867 family)
MYVVAGASGNTGKVVAETLLSQGKNVRALVREAEAQKAWKDRGAEVVSVSLDDAKALGDALAGAEGAYLLLPPQWASSRVREDNAARSAAYAKAIEASGVPHVVFLSSVGAQHDAGTGPITSLHDGEKALAKTRAAVTVVRAAYFMENWGGSLYALPQGKLPSFLSADAAIPMVATRDIGTTAARALVEGGRGKSVIELEGPRAYSPRDVAAALSRITKKDVAVEQAPESAMIAALTGAGLSAHWAELFRELTHGVNVGHIAFEGGAARHVRGGTEVDAVLAALAQSAR